MSAAMEPTGSTPAVAPARMHPDDLAALADLIAERLRGTPEGARVASGTPACPRCRETPREGPILLTAREVAERFGVSAEWVRDHAAALGAVRLGDGPRPRLRFDAEKVAAALSSSSSGRRSDAADAAPRPERGRRAAREQGKDPGLLPIFTLDYRVSEKEAGGRRANGSAPATRESSSPRPEPSPTGSGSRARGRSARSPES